MFLQIRIVRGETSGGGEELVEGRMNAPGAGKDRLGQGIDVGALELRGLAVGEEVAHDLVFGGESGEGLLGGLILSGLGLLGLVVEVEALEENLADLLGRIEIEGRAGRLIDGLLVFGDAGGEEFAGLGEGGGIDADAFPSPSRRGRGRGDTRSREGRAPARTPRTCWRRIAASCQVTSASSLA